MATSACARRHEPCYKQHTAVDDARGVVLDVAVTTGAVSESRMIEAQVDAVRETTRRAIGTVTADAGYAYAKVFGGLERRRIDPVIPTRKDPSRSPVPLRRFRYDARHHLVMLIQAAASGLGAAIGRPHADRPRARPPDPGAALRAPAGGARALLPDHHAASRQRPELRAFRAWILHEAAASPNKSTICTSAAFAPITAFRWLATECSQILSAWSASISQPKWTEPPCRQSVRSGWRWCRKGNGRILECDSEGGE